MKYIKQPNNWIFEIDESTELFKNLTALPVETRPVFLNTTDKDVQDYFGQHRQYLESIAKA